MKIKYVANQVTPEGLDEVQRILLAHKLGQHVALSGPPGVGKTDLVMHIPKMVEQPLFDITCDSYMTESPLVGFPELEGDNGNTVTVWRNGVASEAAENNGIFYGDEFDLLQGSVQKRLNSLFDDRRNIRRRDGKIISAGDGFMGIVSYNPSDKLSKRELEEAVADRFIHVSFDYHPSELEAALSLGDTSGLSLEQRAILPSGDSMRFIQRDGKSWKDYFTGDKVTHADGAIEYDVLWGQDARQSTLPKQLSKEQLAQSIANYFTAVRSFAERGTNELPDEIKQYMADVGEVTNVPLHKPSTRIIKSALAQYDVLTEMGMEPQVAQSYVARLCIDQIAYGKFGQRNVGKVTVHDAATSMAQFYDLIGKPRQTTSFGGN
jgi:MoxR-like ATPase